ncbi:MAG: hypothetical protein R3F31_02030 [Verrucomicrobiales bacterium]
MKQPYDEANKALESYGKFLREELAGIKGKNEDPLGKGNRRRGTEASIQVRNSFPTHRWSLLPWLNASLPGVKAR